MDEKVVIPDALKDALIEDVHASHPVAGGSYVWPGIVGGHT